MTTPPTSVLWVIVAETSFTTTGKPIFAAATAASSGVFAIAIGAVLMP